MCVCVRRRGGLERKGRFDEFLPEIIDASITGFTEFIPINY